MAISISLVNDHVLKEDSVQNWMLSTLSVGNIVSESLAIQDRILLKQVPYDDYLQIIIETMKRKVRIDVTYKRYGTDTPSHTDFEPYYIKLFKQRWYVLGHFHRDATPEKEERDYFTMYSFDRIIEVKMTDVKFEINPDFDALGYFDECYGVVVGDGTPAQRVVLRVSGLQRYYLRDLPLHKSQIEIANGEDYTDFAYNVRPTVDFKGHILSLGKFVKVLEPESLAEDIMNQHKEAFKQYYSK